MSMATKSWLCCQVGAREHYAVPRALHQHNRLAGLYTDFWAGRALRFAGNMVNGSSLLSPLRSLANRFHPELSEGTITAWNLRALSWERGIRRQSRHNNTAGRFRAYAEVGRQFALQVRDSLRQRSLSPEQTILYAYDTGALEVLEWCRERDICCVVNQMDPNRTEAELVQAEESRWPGWSAQPLQIPEEYFVRRQQEWSLADRIVVNSEWTRQALLQQGVSAEKLVVIPLCYEPPASVRASGDGSNAKRRPSTLNAQPATRALRVLFLGQVNLRKGIQYLVAAARLLEKENVRFDVVGPVGITQQAVASTSANLTFHGRATRDQISQWYERADVFVLPTLSDGFAITQLEAMAHGLPVVTTPCCGAVVTDGVDGFVIPARDAEALARTMQRYLNEPELLPQQQTAARHNASQFTLDRLTANLLRLESDLQNS